MLQAILIVLLLLITAVIFQWKKIKKWIKYRKKLDKLPTSTMPAFPLIGHSYLIVGASSAYFHYVAEMANLMFQIMRCKISTFWLGPVPLIIVAHPDAAEVILKGSKHIEKSLVYNFLHPWLGTGLLTASGDKWKQRRRLITPSFHFNILQDFLDVMNEQSQIMIGNIKNQLAEKQKIDVGKAVTMCALDTICETAMGQAVNAQNEDDSAYVKSIYRAMKLVDHKTLLPEHCQIIFFVLRVTELILLRMRSPLLWWKYLFQKMKLGLEHNRLINELHDFTKKIILERKQNKIMPKRQSKRMAFLDILLHTKTEDGQDLSLADIQEEVDTFMFEGHDTTAAAMTWATYLIGRHPEVQRRIFDEIENIFGDDRDRPVTMDDTKKMKYLECVIKESLRLFPSVPMVARVTTEDCVIDKYTVPKGTQVLIFTYLIHHTPLIWENPEVFDPSRFFLENMVGRHPYAYIPFSAGPRNCIGQRFALLEEKVMLSQLLRNFSVTSHDRREDIKMVGDLILRPAKPLNITLAQRCC